MIRARWDNSRMRVLGHGGYVLEMEKGTQGEGEWSPRKWK